MKKATKIFSAIALSAALFAAFAFGACAKDNEPENKDDDNNNVNTVVSDVFLNTAITADAAYAKECDQKGTITSAIYDTRAYYVEEYYGAQSGEELTLPETKTMWVYTPYGYDETKRYDVLILMHGTGEDEGYWFATGENYESVKDSKVKYAPIGNITQNIADNLIKSGDAEPMIIVSVSMYCKGTEQYPAAAAETDYADANNFYKELRNDIMPYIITHYSTYAESDAEEDIVAARDHFGFIGFSRGSRCTYVSVWEHCFDYFSYFGNLSGICYEENLNNILEKLTTGEYKDLNIGFYYAGCGEWDSRVVECEDMYKSILNALGNRLQEGDDIAKGDNCWYNMHIEGGHEYRCWVADFYNCLQVFFK